MTERIALVTGGNRGIGLEICRQLAKQGITVLLGSRDLAKGKSAVSRLHQQGFSNIHPYQLTVNNEDSIQQLYRNIEQDFGRLDILVNNAGIYPDTANSLLAVDLDIMREAMDVNAYAPVRLTQVLLPLMKKHDWGRIVNVSSSMGAQASLGSGSPAYRFSKLTLNFFTRLLARELNGTGIKINAMSPGWVRTDMGGSGAPRSVEQGADTAVWLATLPDNGPHGGYFHDRHPIEW
jgi:NAD(P)-dependent dehydrogenase (short-subunit alcohol dehydrogenase family)